MCSSKIDHNITPKFLQNALGDEHKILSYKVTNGTKPGDNFMSVIYSVDVQLEAKDGPESVRHLLIKCYPSHPGRQQNINKNNMFFKELEVYRTWIPELRRFQTDVIGLKKGLNLPYATFVHGKCIDFQSEAKQYAGKVIDPLDNYIIMEDLRKTWGFRMTNRRESFDMDHMRLVIPEVAKIHALSWAYKNHVEKDITRTFSCLNPNFTPEYMSNWVGFSSKNIDRAVQIMDKTLGTGNELSKASIRFKDMVIKPLCHAYFLDGDETAIQKLLRRQPAADEFGKDSPNPEPWRIICHGDCWSNNMLFRYDEETGKPMEVVLVDLQMPNETCVVNDLVYIIYVCTRTALRKKHLDELLQLYHDKFNEFCKILKTETLPGFNMDSLKFRFHRAKLLGYAMAVCIFPIMLKEEDKALNLEEMDRNKDVSEIFAEVIGNSESNLILHERIIELTQELYDQGVL